MAKVKVKKDSVIFNESTKRFENFKAGTVVEGKSDAWVKRWLESGNGTDATEDQPKPTSDAKSGRRRSKPFIDSSPIDTP